jgi:two-component system sensor histidine kinase UhpB
VEVFLTGGFGAVSLRVSDDGRGIRTENVGAGIRGMRERAIFVGGTLTVGPGADGGAAVRGESFLPRCRQYAIRVGLEP